MCFDEDAAGNASEPNEGSEGSSGSCNRLRSNAERNEASWRPGRGCETMVVRARRGIPKWLRITSLIVGLLAATLAAVQGTYTTMSEHRAASAHVLQEKFDAKLDVTTCKGRPDGGLGVEVGNS